MVFHNPFWFIYSVSRISPKKRSQAGFAPVLFLLEDQSFITYVFIVPIVVQKTES